jgi:hypothetical protein
MTSNAMPSTPTRTPSLTSFNARAVEEEANEDYS